VSCVIELIITPTCIFLRGDINVYVQNCCAESHTVASPNHSGLYFLGRKEKNWIQCFSDEMGGAGWDCVVSVVAERF